jgi:hypothetical protein
MDESGDPNGWNVRDNFVLAGVAVHEGQIRSLSGQLDRLQKRFFPAIAVPLEIHAHHIFAGKGRYRKWPRQRRKALLDEAFAVIANAGSPNLVAFVSAIHVSAVTGAHQALSTCLEDICQRFNTFLVRQFNAGYKDKGLLIMDKSGRDARVRELMAEFDKHGTSRGYLGNIVDVPHFADSSHTRMLQLADLLAFAGGRYFNSNDDSLLSKVLPRIDRRTKGGNPVGLKHIVAPGHPCSCLALH